jgi:hypothetical protein
MEEKNVQNLYSPEKVGLTLFITEGIPIWFLVQNYCPFSTTFKLKLIL